ncbi:MAG: hypothetical protein WA510_13395 [Acidobacteriaceae bacterium]
MLSTEGLQGNGEGVYFISVSYNAQGNYAGSSAGPSVVGIF